MTTRKAIAGMVRALERAARMELVGDYLEVRKAAREALEALRSRTRLGDDGLLVRDVMDIAGCEVGVDLAARILGTIDSALFPSTGDGPATEPGT